MKRILLTFIVAITFCSLAWPQKQVTTSTNSVCQANVTIRKEAKDKLNADSSSITVIGMDADSVNVNNDSSSIVRTSLNTHADDDDFPFTMLGTTIGEEILIPIIAIIATFGMPVFILFLIFFFRYKNRKARYHLIEQALVAGQPLPEGFLKENKQSDQRSQGIKNTFTGIGLFIFLWAITGKFGIGAIGLLIMFVGIGQWLIGRKSDIKVKDGTKTPMEEKTNENQ